MIKQTSSKHRANVKQTSSKQQAIRAHVVHVYFEYICLMFASSCKRGISYHLSAALPTMASKPRMLRSYVRLCNDRKGETTTSVALCDC